MTANTAGTASSASSSRARCLFTTSTMSSTGRKKIACSLNDRPSAKNTQAHHGLRVIRKYRLPRQNAA